MATAKLVQPAPPPKMVVLELSMVEARVLRDVFANIGGCPDYSRRSLTNEIDQALREAKVLRDLPVRDISGSIYFKDAKEMAEAAADKGICRGKPAAPADGCWTEPRPIHQS